ncbi:ethanolamine transporter [Nitzschia inconspicua]|uniref:Ethanolamine transporter n=1 Tax=Nitzschia inconspicua TaxID=303405 RepID=A0A9K3KS19_9STRA|nr:ethanolamine transporter [Nitzschia inconspicua]
MEKKDSNGNDDHNVNPDGVDENTALLHSPGTLRRRRRQEQQQHQEDNHENAIPFPFGSLGSIGELQDQIGELAHDLVTFEPANPEDLARELEEFHNDRAPSDRLSGLSGNLADDLAEATPGPVVEVRIEEPESHRSGGTSVLEGLTYPDMQVIESHYTEAPEKLGCVALAVLIFYNVSGGPFGVETTVRAGGFFYALLGFLLFPFIWSVQEAFMTAELGTAFVEASGGVAWVEEAFGPGAGWMSGYLGWIAGATDNAIYPVLFLDYLFQVFGNDSQEINPVVRFVLLSATSITLAYINWRGLPMVGKMSVGICLLAMSPFVILVVFGAFKCNPSRWFKMPSRNIRAIVEGLDDDVAGGFFPYSSFGGVLWRPYLNNLFWNLNSFDSAGTLVAELDNTALFLKAMIIATVLVISCYFFPLLIAIGAGDSEQSDWTNGYLAAVNAEIVGPWLGAWTVFAAGISNIAMFQAELSSDAFQLMGMADRGHLPKIFSKRSRHGTPTWGLIVGTAVIVSMGVSNLDQLVEMLNFNYALSLLLEYAAFFKLRISKPDLERPYRIPLNTFGCVLFFFPAIAATLVVMSLATFATFYFAIGSWMTGALIFYAKQRSERRNIHAECDQVEGIDTANGK